MADPIEAVTSTAYQESLSVSLDHARLLGCFLNRNPQFEYTTPSLGLYIFKLAFPLILATKVAPPDDQVLLALDIHLKSLDRHTLSYENVPLLKETIEYLMTLKDPRDLCTQFARFLVHEIKRPSFLQLPEKLLESADSAAGSHQSADASYQALFSQIKYDKPSAPVNDEPLGVIGNPFLDNYRNHMPTPLSDHDRTYLDLLLRSDPYPPNL